MLTQRGCLRFPVSSPPLRSSGESHPTFLHTPPRYLLALLTGRGREDVPGPCLTSSNFAAPWADSKGNPQANRVTSALAHKNKKADSCQGESGTGWKGLIGVKPLRLKILPASD